MEREKSRRVVLSSRVLIPYVAILKPQPLHSQAILKYQKRGVKCVGMIWKRGKDCQFSQ